MSVTTTNLIQGPGTLYQGVFGAAEPADSAINTTPAASAWTDMGGTLDGAKLNMDQTFSELTVDQLVDRVGSRLTKRDVMVSTNLAEATLENLSMAINGGTAASGSGFKSLDPNTATSATQPNYFATILDGFAPSSFRRRVILRKVLNTSKVEMAYTKDKQTVIPVEFTGHYVSNSITSFHIVDQTS